ncbi:MAG: hypothetical protein HKN31_13135 [Pricia sp.]|nr:hypothetical protein [Pricia sp.]
MALFLLASTTSWTVGKHYCMGRLMDVSFFAHADDCGMDMSTAKDNTTSGIQDESSCCSSEMIMVGGQDNLKVSFNDFSIGQQLFLVAFTHSYFNLFQIETEPPLPNNYYPPPLLIKDIQLLDEVFLI